MRGINSTKTAYGMKKAVEKREAIVESAARQKRREENAINAKEARAKKKEGKHD